MTRSITLIATLLASCNASITTNSRVGSGVDCSGEQALSDDCAANENPQAKDSEDTKTNTQATDTIQGAAKLASDSCVDPDLAKLASDQTIMLCDGTVARGSLVIPSAHLS